MLVSSWSAKWCGCFAVNSICAGWGCQCQRIILLNIQKSDGMIAYNYACVLTSCQLIRGSFAPLSLLRHCSVYVEAQKILNVGLGQNNLAILFVVSLWFLYQFMMICFHVELENIKSPSGFAFYYIVCLCFNFMESLHRFFFY